MTVYSSAARRQLDELQAMLDLHAISTSSGRCVVCDVDDPCLPRRDALFALAVRYELPHRLAGATRPELIDTREVADDAPGTGP
jgi:hypothetical protein